ncbi:hypothetical protein GW17_00054936 [Ensete ventricosum]|nr:hypothetical protein GW17_00054936 [Ensete ventricosum]
MAGRGATLVLRTSWFNCSSWIRAKEITTIRVYGCRAFTSPRISGFRPLIKREEVPLLASSGGGFILTGRRLDRMLGLTFADTLGEVTVYSESVDTEVWREGVACHVTLMARGGGLATAPSDRLYLRC